MNEQIFLAYIERVSALSFASYGKSHCITIADVEVLVAAIEADTGICELGRRFVLSLYILPYEKTFQRKK